MENENNNYSFTPITEDNSVNEIKSDFFGGNNPEPSNPTPSDVPPILEVPEIKEEGNPTSAPATEPVVNDVAATDNNVAETSVTPTENVSVTNPEEAKQEPSNEPPVVHEEVTITPEPITEVNQAPVADTPSEPVEVKIPEGLDEETTTSEEAELVVNNLESTAMPSEQPTLVVEPVSNQAPAPVVEQPVQAPEPVNNAEPKVEAPKKGKSIFDFFKKDTPPVDNSKPEPSIETSSGVDPFNNFVADVPESEPTPTAPVVEPVVEPIPEAEPSSVPEPSVEVPLPSIEETPVIEENKEASLPSVDEPISEPVIEPITTEETVESTFNNENNFESVKEPEPVVKEVVVEKEKVVLGKKCSNCGEVTAETFCPNCGFLVE